MLPKNYTVMAITAEYSQFLINCNDLQSRRFCAWNFASGTLFEQSEQWWVATGTRPNPHEGIDFCTFEDQAGQEILLDETFKVPVMFDGKVVDIFDDFLKETLLVAHDYYVDGWQLHSLYGHVLPKGNMSRGVEVMAGDIIAMVAPQKHPLITPHLHLSVLLVKKDCRGPIRWQSIRSPGLRLCNPLDYINDMVFFLQ